VAAGDSHTCGLGTDSTVTCWGSDGYRIRQVPPGSYSAITSGDEHACALSADGFVQCWGRHTIWGSPFSPQPICGPAGYGVFDDVSGSNPFCSDITWLVEEAIAEGFVDGGFHPLATISRQALAAFLYRYAGEPPFLPPGTPTFSDVPVSHQFFVEIEWLAMAGITGGFADGGYHPGAPITRQSVAAFLYRTAGEPAFIPPTSPTFDDVPLSHPFFVEIEWLASTGVTTGYPDGGYHPTAPVTRQAFAAFLHRYDDLPT
jgi:hypothetical protein